VAAGNPRVADKSEINPLTDDFSKSMPTAPSAKIISPANLTAVFANEPGTFTLPLWVVSVSSRAGIVSFEQPR